MDGEKLIAFYKTDETAKWILDHMARRERNQTETKVDRIIQLLKDEGRNVVRGNVIRVLKKLEEISCGQFIGGRHGWPSRFVWDVGSLSVSRYATGEADQVEQIKKESEDEEGFPEFLNHEFNLRSDMAVKFSLPNDLTEKEAERLASFIKTLPMEDVG